MVRSARLELAHLAALPPQDSVSTNSTMIAKRIKAPKEGLNLSFTLSQALGLRKER